MSNHELGKRDLINHIKGITKLSKNKLRSLTKIYIEREDRYQVAKEIAEGIASDTYLPIMLYTAGQLGPDLPEDKKNQLLLEVLIQAASVTLTEQIKPLQSNNPFTENKVIKIYKRLIYENFHISLQNAKKLVKSGIGYHGMVADSLNPKK